jgi:DNA-binding transcriptional LysR family regulator
MNNHQRFLAGLAAFVGVEGTHSLSDAEGRNGLPKRSSIATHLKQFNEILDCNVMGAGVKRTEAGKRIEEDAKRMLKDLDQSIRRAQEHLKRLAQTDRPVGIAMSPTIWSWAVPTERLPLVNLNHPSAEFLVANSSRVEKVVRDGLFEIGITAGRRAGSSADAPYATETFAVDEIVVLVPPDHDWAKRMHLEAEDLSTTPVIALDVTANARQIVDSAMQEARLELAEPLEEAATAGLALEEAVRLNQPALLPKIVLETDQGRMAETQGFSRKHVKNLKLTRDVVLIYQRPPMLRAEAKKTVDALRDLLSSARASRTGPPARALLSASRSRE